MPDHQIEKQAALRHGIFGQYSVFGIKGQDDLGNPGWEITAYIQSDSDTHTYWVSVQEFHSMSVHIPLDGSPQQVQIHGIIPYINLEEKKAVFDAIAQWENSTSQKPDSSIGFGANS